MSRCSTTFLALVACIFLTGWSGHAEAAHRQLVLVCSLETEIPSLSKAETRQLFLGVTVQKDRLRIRPLRNQSDPVIEEVFLQKVIFMSKRNYERKLLSRVFRMGGTRPPKFSDVAGLLDEIRKSSGAVSYMWSDQIKDDKTVKSLSILWEGTVE